MKSNLLPILAATALTLGLASSSEAQVVGQQASALTNVPSVDAQVAITWDETITQNGGPGEAHYSEQFDAEFKRGLQRAGIKVDPQAPNYLYCSIALLYNNGSVAAAQSIEFHEQITAEGQWAITWTHMQVYTVGLNNFGGQDDAQWCHQRFIEDWRQVNQAG